VVVFVLIMRNVRKHFQAHSFSLKRFGWVLGAFVLVIVVGAGYLKWFALSVYPQIPEQFGGGQPRVVQLQVAKDAAEDVHLLGIPMLKGSPITRRVELLFEGGDFYLVRSTPKIVQQSNARAHVKIKTVKLDKTSVVGIRIEESIRDTP
jgi:hypothetical protein